MELLQEQHLRMYQMIGSAHNAVWTRSTLNQWIKGGT